MITPTDVYASDQPLATLRLERELELDETERDAIRELLDAVDDLTRDWLVPLAVGALVECCDPSRYYEPIGEPARPSWFTRADGVDARVAIRHAYSNATEYPARADRADVRGMVDRALAQVCDEGELSFAEMTWTAVRIAMPVPAIRVRYAGGSVNTVIHDGDGGRWILGPVLHELVGPPARLRAVNEHGSLTIDLHLYWDLWTDVPAGRATVEGAAARVEARGRGWVRA